MNDGYRTSLSRSAAAFQAVVWPQISQHALVGGGELKPVEAKSMDSFKDELDLLAGIDAWQILRDRAAIRGPASRVQWNSDFKYFAVRLSRASGQKTEFAKRLDAIRSRAEGHLFVRHQPALEKFVVGGAIDRMYALTYAMQTKENAMATLITASEARADLYRLIDQTAESHQPILISGKRSSAVLVSAEDWQAIQETLYLLSVPGMRESIKKGMAEPLGKSAKAVVW